MPTLPDIQRQTRTTSKVPLFSRDEAETLAYFLKHQTGPRKLAYAYPIAARLLRLWLEEDEEAKERFIKWYETKTEKKD